MFAVLVFKAWIELKHYKIMEGTGVRQTYQLAGRILKAEKDLFCKIEGGDELYRLLCEIFKVKD